MRLLLRTSVFCLVAGGLAATSRAQMIDYFLGGSTTTSGDYATPGNWSSGLPTTGTWGLIASGNTATLATDVSGIVSDQILRIGSCGPTDPYFSEGSGTASGAGQLDVNSGGYLKLSGGSGLVVGGTASGILNVYSGGTVSADEAFIGAYSTSLNGVVNQYGGSVAITHAYISGGNGANQGAYNISGGLLSCADMRDGVNATNSGTLTQSGGTVSISGSMWVGTEAGGSIGAYNVTSGVASIGGLILGNGDNSLGHLVVTGGTLTVSALNLAVQANSGGTVELDGGVLSVHSVSTGAGTTTFDFGGGTLKARDANLSVALPMNLTGMGGNATVDTNGYSVTLGGTLSGIGGLNKVGNGSLTLSNNNLYSGPTAVNAGELVLAGSNATGAVSVASAAKLTLTAASPFAVRASRAMRDRRCDRGHSQCRPQRRPRHRYRKRQRDV